MSIETKIEKIKVEKESAVEALSLYLDSIYNMTDKFFDNQIQEIDGKEKVVRVLKEGLDSDPKIEKFVQELNNDASEYEKVRVKLQNGDFNLSLPEIARIGLAFTFSALVIEKRINESQKALTSIKSIIDLLMEGETQNVDFSKEN